MSTADHAIHFEAGIFRALRGLKLLSRIVQSPKLKIIDSPHDFS